VYAVMSITKQFTAAAILKLEGEGRLRLDDDISRHLADLPMVRGPVTLRHLLHHTAGIAGFGRLPGKNGLRLDYSRDEWLAVLRDMYKDRVPEFAPGHQWAYRDVNYALLGFVVEKLSGRPLAEYFRSEFFLPLGMARTGWCDPGSVVKGRATAYVPSEGRPGDVAVAPYVSPTVRFGNNGLCASAVDLLLWQRALVENRVPGVAYARMTRTGTLSDGRALDYAAGLVVWPLRDRQVVFHPGGGGGFTSFLAYLPASDVTVIVMANASTDILRIGADLARIAAGLPPPRNLALTGDEVARYAGTYASGPVNAVVQENGGGLEATVTGTETTRFAFPVRLLKQADGEFVVGWEPESQVSFRVTGGRATAVVLRFGGRTVELPRELVAPPDGS
jgi:CubicO group peptidase (beta-lactamase class C family)